MTLSLLLYLIFVLPFSLNKYRIDRGKNIFIKILNSLITLYIWIFLTPSAKLVFKILKGANNTFIPNASLIVNELFAIGLLCVSILAVVLNIRLALRISKARKTFLIVIPFIILFHGIKDYFLTYNYPAYGVNYAILLVFISSLIWTGIFLFYISKPVQRFLL